MLPHLSCIAVLFWQTLLLVLAAWSKTQPRLGAGAYRSVLLNKSFIQLDDPEAWVQCRLPAVRKLGMAVLKIEYAYSFYIGL